MIVEESLFSGYGVFKDFIKGKTVALAGVGVSNLPLVEFFKKLGAEVVCCDKKTADKFDKKIYNTLKSSCKALYFGEDYLEHFSGCDVILRSPGIRYDNPAFTGAVKEGAVLTGEIELFLALCPCKTIGITGSDGKTTTTTLICKMLEQSGKRCFLGGNIGAPLLNRIEEIEKDDVAVVELSSFQLHNMRVSPDVAVITNITPNHLDYHTDYNEYIESKKNVYLYGDKETKLVVNYDNDITCKAGKENKITKTVFFSKDKIGGDNVYLDDGIIFNGSEPVLKMSDIKIRGIHNVENYMAAIAAVGDCVSREDIVSVAKSFGGVAHRMELVRERNGVSYYNDSIASTPTRTAAGLRACDRKVILIAGGYDKHISYEEFGDVVAECVKYLVLVGQTGPAIRTASERALAERHIEIPIADCETFEQAVRLAHSVAKDGDYVILSPASASFDMFKNFEERGNIFKDIVNGL